MSILTSGKCSGAGVNFYPEEKFHLVGWLAGGLNIDKKQRVANYRKEFKKFFKNHKN